jgi:hypothetical protein
MAQVVVECPEAKLIFPGTRHPNPNLAGIPTHDEQARSLAAELGLLDRAIYFGDWVSYVDWPNVLLESDVAISLHQDSYETRLAYRSRMLDYIWAGLPVVAATGDTTSDLVASFGVGEVVAYGAVDAVADAILRLLNEPPDARAAGFARARQMLTWEQAAAPLVAFCAAPQRAPDRVAGAPPGGPGWLLSDHQAQRVAELEQAATQAQVELGRWRELVDRYEQGRFIRTMRRLDALKRHIWTRP